MRPRSHSRARGRVRRVSGDAERASDFVKYRALLTNRVPRRRRRDYGRPSVKLTRRYGLLMNAMDLAPGWGARIPERLAET